MCILFCTASNVKIRFTKLTRKVECIGMPLGKQEVNRRSILLSSSCSLRISCKKKLQELARGCFWNLLPLKKSSELWQYSDPCSNPSSMHFPCSISLLWQSFCLRTARRGNSVRQEKAPRHKEKAAEPGWLDQHESYLPLVIGNSTWAQRSHNCPKMLLCSCGVLDMWLSRALTYSLW